MFRFVEVFPHSNKKAYFVNKEKEAFGLQSTPEQVKCEVYLQPFLGNMTFSQLNVNTFDRFTGWARKQQFRGKTPANETINKCFTVLKMICKSVAIEYGWSSGFEPFFGFKKLPEGDPYEHIMPFAVEEQQKLLEHLPEHWRPYFRFAFCSGLRVGEQLALKPGDID